jgi:lysophospholipase L1-like esterase
MVFGRACVALLALAVTAGFGVAAQTATKPPVKKPATAAAKRPVVAGAAKPAGTIRRAPAAQFTVVKKKPLPGKPGAKKAVVVGAKGSVARASVATARSASAPVYAPGAVPTGGREATIGRITESLASARVGIEGAAALQPFFDQLRQLEADPKSGVVRILQFGDSHTAADMFTGAMRTLFQTKFGDGGAGYSYPGYPFAGYRIHGTRRAQSTGWLVTGTKFRDLGDGLLGMGGVSLSTAQPGNWISLDADATSLQVQYLIQPGGGNIEIYDGDDLLEAVSTDGPTAAGHYEAAVEPGPHHFEVRTMSYAPVRLFGMRTEEPAGVTYEAIGLNGAEAGLILKWNEMLQQELMEQRDAALIVLAYGTNEASDSNWDEESYAAMFRRLIERCRRLAPKAAILVLGPADRELRAGRRGWAPYSGIDRIVRAQRSVCKAMGCAYWDERSRMGGFGAMRDWVSVGWGQGDHTHFTGEGYTELAAALFSDIVQQYNSYEGGRGMVGGTSK